MADLFISYAKPDRSLATELADELRGRGFSVWIDQGGIGGAKNWSTEIVEAINGCSTLLVLLSSDSIASHNVAKEVQLASEKRKNILPIVVEKVALPAVFEYPLVGLQRVYYHDRPAIMNALELLKGAIATTGQLLPMIATVPDDRSVRVAVLPFDDLSPKHDNQWFADGMMDELIGTLGHLDKVKVPGRSDVLHYREHHAKSREIARELGVRYLIEGGVRKAGEKIRINAALIDTEHTEQLWANQFDGSFDDVFAFQESVSRHITDALKLQLTPQEEEQIESRPTENPEAYELYLKGRHEQYYFTKESYLRALDLYELAAALDPNYIDAYIGIASLSSIFYREYSKDLRWLDRADESLIRAEAIAGESSRSLSVRGMIEWLKGRNDSAIIILKRAATLDPKNYRAFNILGNIYITAGNYPSAIEAFQNAVAITEDTHAYSNLLTAMSAEDNHPILKETARKALPVFNRYLLREPTDHYIAVSRAFILMWSERKEEAIDAANLLLERNDLNGIALYNLGCLYDHLGSPKMYISLLRKAIENGYREIDRTRNRPLETKDPECQHELNILISEFEDVVRREIASQPQ